MDTLIRDTSAVGMEEGPVVTIEFFSGFELFGHYENWAQGYKVTGRGVSVTCEWLDDALERWASKVVEANIVGTPPLPS